MDGLKRKLIVFSAALTLIPFAYIRAEESKSQPTIIGNILNPDKLFDALKQNITIPISENQGINLPSATKALENVAPKLKEINTEVKDEAGIDLSKFLAWFVKILKIFFQFIIDMLEKVSEALKS